MEYCDGGDLFKTMLMKGGLLDEYWVCVEVGPGSGVPQLWGATFGSATAGSGLGRSSSREGPGAQHAPPPTPSHPSHPSPAPPQIIAPLLRILEKMHSMKLMHRDIKPENIFLTGLGKFKLGDFGLAIKFDEEIPFSRSGTLDYMAPEVGGRGGARRAWLAGCSAGGRGSRAAGGLAGPAGAWAPGPAGSRRSGRCSRGPPVSRPGPLAAL
jgi:serine/threonine protein kinase